VIQKILNVGHGDVVAIPPRAIHSIHGAYGPEKAYRTMEELQENPAKLEDYAAEVRFGENSCMHIYRPD